MALGTVLALLSVVELISLHTGIGVLVLIFGAVVEVLFGRPEDARQRQRSTDQLNKEA